MYLKKIIFPFLFVIFYSGNVFAQAVTVKASLDSTDILIGQQAALKLEVTQSKGELLNFPYFEKGSMLADGIEIISFTKNDTAKISKDEIKITQKFIITSFDTGHYTIPPFVLMKINQKFETDSLRLNVRGVEIPENAELKDIKPQYEPPFNWLLFLLICAGSLLLLSAIAFAVYALIQKKKKRPIPFFNKRIIPELPHEAALRKLQQIKEEKLWQKGEIKLFYTQLTDTLREYLSKTFGIQAMEMTSAEIIAALKPKNEAKQTLEKLSQIFSVADMVKFAKYQPATEDNDICLVNSFFAVNEIAKETQTADLLQEKEKQPKETRANLIKETEGTDPYDSNRLLEELVAYGLDWGIYLRHNSETMMTPFMIVESNDQHYLKTLETDGDPIKYAKSILDKEEVERVAIGYEGLLQEDETSPKKDSIIVQGFDAGQERGVAIGQMFNPKEKGDFQKIGRPLFLGNPGSILPKKQTSDSAETSRVNIQTNAITENNGTETYMVRISHHNPSAVALAIKQFIQNKVINDAEGQLSGKFEFFIPPDTVKNENFLEYLVKNAINEEIGSPSVLQWCSKTGRKIDVVCKYGTKLLN